MFCLISLHTKESFDIFRPHAKVKTLQQQTSLKFLTVAIRQTLAHLIKCISLQGYVCVFRPHTR